MDLGAKHVSFRKEFHFLAKEALEDLGDGETLISNLQIHAGTLAHKFVAHESFRVRDVTLKNLWAKLQIPPPWSFDRTDIFWKKKIKQERNRSKTTCKAIIPWNMLQWEYPLVSYMRG